MLESSVHGRRALPVHILLIHQLFIRPQDAGGTRHYEFARYLAQRGHRVTVLAGTRSYLTGADQAAPGVEALEPGLAVLRIRVPAGGQRSFLRRSLGFLAFLAASTLAGLRVRGVQAVWGTSPPLSQGLAAWTVARLKRVPWIFEVRDLWPDFAVQLGVLRNPLWIRLAKGLERFLYRRADHLVVNSPGFVDPLVREGAPPGRITLIPNGVETADFDPAADGARLRAEHSLRDKFVALYAGAHGAANGLELVLQAAELLRDDPHTVFVLVGDGKEKPSLQRQAEARKLPNLRFLPPVPKSGIPEMLSAADCCLAVLSPIPLFATTYPNKVFDYMAAGRPVVLAIDGPIRQLIEGAGAGLTVTPGDAQAFALAVARLAADERLRREMGRKGRACVQAEFERSRQVEALEAVFTELVAA